MRRLFLAAVELRSDPALQAHSQQPQQPHEAGSRQLAPPDWHGGDSSSQCSSASSKQAGALPYPSPHPSPATHPPPDWHGSDPDAAVPGAEDPLVGRRQRLYSRGRANHAVTAHLQAAEAAAVSGAVQC
jgi:hypothetical protein